MGVVSLLEVGTGFHPELTARENIFLNGAILGMGKEEIKRKFDEVVAFAEIEKFLDTLEVETYGNVLAATAFIQGLATQELTKQELDYRDPSYQVLITVRAVKPEVTL